MDRAQKPPEAAEPDIFTDEPPHAVSLTELAAQAMRSGVSEAAPGAEELEPEDPMRAGDPDADPLANEMVGEEIPGGGTPTPDQSQVDAIGRAYGVTDQDAGAFVSTEELITRRDVKRWELDPRSKDRDR
jgi:hypothetical protein